MLKQYNEDEDESVLSDDDDEDEAPELITAREDFTSMMDEFLNDFEILGRKLKPKLEGDTGAEKLETLRRAMGQDERVCKTLVGEDDDNDNDDNEFLRTTEEDKKDRWDCETILCKFYIVCSQPFSRPVYSNLFQS